MKKKLLILAGSLMALAAVTTTVVATNSNDEASLLMRNVEAMARGEGGTTVTVCAAAWGDCSIGGASSKGPLVQVEF